MAAAARAALASAVPGPGPAAETTLQPHPRAATRQQPLPSYVPPAPVPVQRSGGRVWPVLAAVFAVAAVVGWTLWGLGVADGSAAADDAQQQLLAVHLPGDVDPAGDCDPGDEPDGVLASLDCGPSSTDGGPTEARYELHPDADGAGAAFAADVAGRDLPALEGTSDCGSDGPGSGTWFFDEYSDDAQPGGSFACYVDDEGDAVFSWTVDAAGLAAVVQQRGGGESGLSGLASWWSSNADPDR